GSAEKASGISTSQRRNSASGGRESAAMIRPLLLAGREAKLHVLGRFDLLGRVQQLDGDKAAGPVVIQNHARFRLIALGNLAVAQDDRERIGFFVVDDFHGVLQYLVILLVLYAVTTW